MQNQNAKSSLVIASVILGSLVIFAVLTIWLMFLIRLTSDHANIIMWAVALFGSGLLGMAADAVLSSPSVPVAVRANHPSNYGKSR